MLACVIFCYSNAPAKDDVPADNAVESENSTHSEYPRARYKSLLDDYEFLRDEKFYGRVFPVRFVKIPMVLKHYVESGNSLLYVQTRRRKYAMYMIVPDDRVKGIRNVIDNGGELRCVYSPVSMYHNAPVILFVDGSIEISSAVEKEERAPEPEREKKPVIAAKPKTELPEKSAKAVAPEKPKKAGAAVIKGLARYYPCTKGAQWTISVGKDVRMIEFEILDVTATEAQGIKREMIPNKPELDKTSDYRVVYTKKSILTMEQGVDAMGNPFEKQEVLLEEPLQPGKQWTEEVDKVSKTKEIVAVDATVTAGTEENPVTYKDVVIVREDIRDEKFYAVVYNYYGANVGFIGCKIDSSEKKESLKKHDEITEWFMMRTN
jgi:hypothetical protein